MVLRQLHHAARQRRWVRGRERRRVGAILLLLLSLLRLLVLLRAVF